MVIDKLWLEGNVDSYNILHKGYQIANKDKTLQEVQIKSDDQVVIQQQLENSAEDEEVDESRIPILTKQGYKCTPSIVALCWMTKS